MGSMRVPDTLGFLRGHWQIERVLVDHRTGTRGYFTGSAAILPATTPDGPLASTGGLAASPDGRLASYTEQGELRFGSHTGPAQRILGFQPRPDGTAAVRFANGRPFYVLDLRSGHCQAEHPCHADRYRITHVVHNTDLIEERWQVSGPDKDYHAITRLRRKPVPDGPIHRTIDGNNMT
jgi:Family of unknown function (DUF6314)